MSNIIQVFKPNKPVLHYCLTCASYSTCSCADYQLGFICKHMICNCKCVDSVPVQDQTAADIELAYALSAATGRVLQSTSQYHYSLFTRKSNFLDFKPLGFLLSDNNRWLPVEIKDNIIAINKKFNISDPDIFTNINRYLLTHTDLMFQGSGVLSHVIEPEIINDSILVSGRITSAMDLIDIRLTKLSSSLERLKNLTSGIESPHYIVHEVNTQPM